MTDIVKIKDNINKQLANAETLKSLLDTTFKGLEAQTMKRAMLEGMMRGFEFKDFLEKNVYAIPFKGSYSLITSIDYARKIGMKSGVVGKSAPIFEMDGDKIISCTVTIKRKVGDHIGEYTDTAFFDEYNTGRNLWLSKPRTMIAKVAEMHALRMACPEELSQAYVEEEYQREAVKVEIIKEPTQEKVEESRNKLEEAKDIEEVKKVWASLPLEVKNKLEDVKNELKKKYENN